MTPPPGGTENVSSKMLCLKCISDDAVRALARQAARKTRCAYCRVTRRAVSISDLAAIVDEPLRVYSQQGEVVPRFSRDSDSPSYEQEGEDLNSFLQYEIGIDYEPAEDLAKELMDRDPAYPGDGDDPYFASDQAYQRRTISAWEFDEVWVQFSERIKHERRFFDPIVTDILERILGKPGSAAAGELPVFMLGPGTETLSIFRARTARSEQEALTILRAPSRELGPPPKERATAGRMNPSGIPVFYGALSADTAIAELRPSVGSIAIVGRFSATRELRLLDFSHMGVGFTGSLFAPEYEERATRLRFLSGFHSLIARPVQQGDEPLGYLPTQAVAEYVVNILEFDGLLYASAQVGAAPDEEESDVSYIPQLGAQELEQHNVVLIGPAGMVEGNDSARSRDVGGSGDVDMRGDTPPSLPERPRGLRYDVRTAEARRIRALTVDHVAFYVHDPDAVVAPSLSRSFDLFLDDDSTTPMPPLP